MNKPRVNAEQAEGLEKLNGTDYFTELGKYAYELTLDDAARWLREKKGWHVIVMPDGFGVSNDLTWTCAVYQIIEKMNPQPMILRIKSSTISHYPDHDTALSEGISLILKKETDAETK
jgi:hypothetical protein